MLFLSLLGMAYIANAHKSEVKMRKIQQLEKKLNAVTPKGAADASGKPPAGSPRWTATGSRLGRSFRGPRELPTPGFVLAIR